MKLKEYGKVFLALLCVFSVFTFHVAMLQAAAPTVVTSPATDITKTNATLVGYVSNDGGEVITATGFDFGLTASYGQTISGNEEYLFTTLISSSGTAEDELNSPRGIEVDASDNVFVSDKSNNRIQKLTASGTFVTMFGWGVDTGAGALESCVSGCQAGTAGAQDGRLQGPYGVNVDSGGNIYVADNLNGRVQKFTSAGAYDSQFTGGGLFRVADIDFDSSGNIYATELSGDVLYKFDSSGTLITSFGSLGSGNNQFNNPEGIYIDDADNIYVADSGNDRIQILDTSGTFVSRWGVSGTGEGELSAPLGISMNSAGEIAVANFTNSVVQKFTSSGTFISAVNTTGSGALSGPTSVDFDSEDNLYVVNSSGDNVKKYRKSFTADLSAVVPSLTCGTTYHFRAYASNGSGTSFGSDETFTTLDCDVPSLETNPASSVTTTDATLNATYIEQNKVTATEHGFEYGLTTSYGSTASVAEGIYKREFGSSQLSGSSGVVVDDSGNAFVGDYSNSLVRKYDSSGALLDSFGGVGDGDIFITLGVGRDGSGNVYAVDNGNALLKKFDSLGNFSSSIGSGELASPQGVYIDSDGTAYVTDNALNIVLKFNSAGTHVTDFGGAGVGDLSSPMGITRDTAGNFYVADTGNNVIKKFNSAGTYISGGDIGTAGSGDGQLNAPSGVAVNSDGEIYVSDNTNLRVQKFDSTGTYLLQFGQTGTGDGEFASVTGIALDEASGDIYAVDGSNNRIQVFNDHFDISISSLTCGTTYHYRAYATNADGTGYGSDNTFTTSGCPGGSGGGGGGSNGTHFICTDVTAVNYTSDRSLGKVNNDICNYPKKETPPNELSCTTPLYLTRPVKFGAANDVNDVKLLEKYLNTYEGYSLPVDGVYSKTDFNAVVLWQEKYASEILKPWGLSKGTGYVFITSLRKIKSIHEAECAKNGESYVSDACYLYDQKLKRGDKNNFVKFAQKALRASGSLAGSADGVFGLMTEEAVKNFQIKNNLGADGVIGPATGLKLSEVKCEI